MRRFSTILIALAAAAGLQAGIISDGSFEIPTASTQTGYTGSLGDGWFATQGTIGISSIADGAPGVPHSGSQFAYLDWSDTVNTLSQSFTTMVGQAYVISYWVADNVPDTLSVSFGSQILFNGTAPTNGVSLPSDYVNYIYTVTATSTTSSLSFTGQWLELPNAYGTILDDVSVTAASSVPEPLTMGLTGLGLLACAAGLRARRRS
jgi:hypothetical protein